jgi:hypothetical protein
MFKEEEEEEEANISERILLFVAWERLIYINTRKLRKPRETYNELDGSIRDWNLTATTYEEQMMSSSCCSFSDVNIVTYF